MKTCNIQKYIKEAEIILAKMKRDKAAGPDEIVIEMLVALDEFDIDKITELINKIYSGDILENLSRSVFIVLLKKPGANLFELHLTTSIMMYITKFKV